MNNLLKIIVLIVIAFSLTSCPQTFLASKTPMHYEVSFDANGGIVNTAQMSVAQNGSAGTLPIPTKAGSYFWGWYSDYGTFQHLFTEDTKVTQPLMVYAKWGSENYLNEGYVYTRGNGDYYGEGYIVHNVPMSVSGDIIIKSSYNDGVNNEHPVIGIDYSAFQDNDNITSVLIPNTVTYIGGYAFSNCDNLTSITIPDTVTLLQNGVFRESKNLKTVSLGSGIEHLGLQLFYICYNLASLTIGENVSSINTDNIVSRSYNLTSIDVHEANSTFKAIDGNVYSKDGKTLVLYAPGKTETSFSIPYGVETIGSMAFAENENLQHIIIPNTVTTIGDRAFWRASLLKTVSMGNSITTIGNSVFESCHDLITINIPDSVTTIGDGAFANCYDLKTVNIGKGLTSIGINAFERCDEIEYISVDPSNTSYRSIEGVLYTHDKKTLIKYPNKSNTSFTIPYYVTSIASHAFYRTENLTKLIISEGVTSIGESAFEDCHDLQTVYIPSTLTTIPTYAFSSCGNLETVYIEEGLTTIEWHAFVNCQRLTTITIPDSVTDIQNTAFLYGDDIETVYTNRNKDNPPPNWSKDGNEEFFNATWRPIRVGM